LASFTEHIKQAQANIDFLCSINKHSNSHWDWQTTVCFYVGVHLINAHIAQVVNQHYRSHEQVDQAINPYNQLSLCRLSEDVYKSYRKLQMLSRRSRYLISDAENNYETKAFFTSDKHFAKAVRELDKLIHFVKDKYSIPFSKKCIDCDRIKSDALNYFEHSELLQKS
jgi:hypothetical protein